MIIFFSFIVFLLLIFIFLPKILKILGLNPDYPVKRYRLEDRKALIITTSHNTLDKSKKPTGVYAAEMTTPYYRFSDAGLSVDLASIEGGVIPIEKWSLRWPLKTEHEKKFLNDPVFLKKIDNSIKIDDVSIANYDLIFLSGGWGAAYDFGVSEALGEKISDAYASEKIIGAVCHGPLGLLKAKDESGKPIVKDRKITGVTDRQIKELRITETPMHPEKELRKAGADFKYKKSWLHIFADHVVLDGNIITGQNQNASSRVAEIMLERLSSQ